MIRDSEPQGPASARSPQIARVYGTLIVLLGLWATYVMSRPLWRSVEQGGGIGLHVLPVALIALMPALVFVYLGRRIMQGERMAVYAVAIVMVLIGGVVMVLDTLRGGYLIGATMVGLAPLCRAAMRESGGFH